MPQRYAMIGLCLSLLVAPARPASIADLVVIQLMRKEGHGTHVEVLRRTAVTPELDMVVVLGSQDEPPPEAGSGAWWSDRRKLGLFLQQRTNPGLIYRIAVAGGPPGGDCHARVERTASTDVVISCTPEKGRAGPNHKFIYDVRAKALVKEVVYDPFGMHALFTLGKTAVFVGSDCQRAVAVEFGEETGPVFRLLSGRAADMWTSKLAFSTGTVGAGPEQRTEINPELKFVEPAPFGLGSRFRLTRRSEARSAAESLVVREQIGPKHRLFALPRSTYEAFAKARPSRVKDGYSRQSTSIDEQIGAWQVADGTLWIGKTFYDGEGSSGVGGFGYFDAGRREYRIYSPPEIRNWSVTAMLVEPDAVWLGLASHGEWATNPGGLLQFDRAPEKANTLALPDIVGQIARVGNRLVMATSFGIAVLDGAKPRRFFIDQTADGKLRVVEAFPGAGRPDRDRSR